MFSLLTPATAATRRPGRARDQIPEARAGHGAKSASADHRFKMTTFGPFVLAERALLARARQGAAEMSEMIVIESLVTSVRRPGGLFGHRRRGVSVLPPCSLLTPSSVRAEKLGAYFGQRAF